MAEYFSADSGGAIIILSQVARPKINRPEGPAVKASTTLREREGET